MKKLLLTIIAALSTAVSSFASIGALSALQRHAESGSLRTFEPPEVSAPASLPDSYVPKTAQSVVSLSDFRGKTFLQFMVAPNGMKAALDKAQLESLTFADKNSIRLAADRFDGDVYKKILRSLTGGQTGLDQLMDALAGKTTTPDHAAGIIAGELKELNLAAQPEKIGLTAVAAAPFLALASGNGVTTILDRNNYYLNYGYKSGNNPAELEKDVKSGRSFGASTGHKALDVSDKYYLLELDKLLTSTEDTSSFYRTLLEVITRCDSSRLPGLPTLTQTVATDFIAVYTAEIDRHAMAGFKTHPWENDLAEATLVSSYASTERKVVVGGKLVDGAPVNFFGVGVQGSGIGIMRKDRRTLQLAVANLERKLHPELVGRVETLIGRRGGDVFHNLMTFLNNPQNQSKVQASAAQLTDAIVEFLAQVHVDSRLITDDVKSNGLPGILDNDSHNEQAGHDNNP